MERDIVLTVIIPVYNGEKYLKRMIEQLKKQTFQKFEAIFIDDGSTDNTYELCKCFAENDSRIHVIHIENHGVSYARNVGIGEAKGKWIQFIDVDDIIHINMFSTFNDILEESEADLAVCGCIRKRQDLEENIYCGPGEDRFLQGKDITSLLRETGMEQRYWLLDYVWNKWYKRSLIKTAYICFPENLALGEDFVFNTRYFQHINSLALISDYCYEYEVHRDGLASSFQQCPWRTRAVLYDSQKELYKVYGIWEEEFQRVRRQYGQIYWGDLRGINSEKCHLRNKEKLMYIKRMADSELFGMIIDYLQLKKGIAYKIYNAILKTKNIYTIWYVIQCEKFLVYLRLCWQKLVRKFRRSRICSYRRSWKT